ncbi:MAG TPA: serine O-acetyltransferase EpsC [Thermodesulfovibrionales bacterium]|nr:serine O-acetyltransferase EpsC [Thermodesulfovibrionales bacterium]
MDDSRLEQCKIEREATRRFREEIPGIVSGLVHSCNTDECFDHVDFEPLPSKERIIEIIHVAGRILYPGYFTNERIDKINLTYSLGQEATTFFESLSGQITLAIRHECRRHNMSCIDCEEKGQEIAIEVMKELPRLRVLLGKDICAAHEGDPAAKTYDEIIFSYPGLFAITVYRLAHELYKRKVSLIPRIMTEYAHSQTGIDIHPGAEIGESFFIDHGTGVVIGETTEIGKRVRLYQGVTLGALSLPKDAVEQLRNEKRHPTIEDDAIIYAGVTILGGETVIGARSVIGGNTWLTSSVPADTKVALKKPELVYK